MSDRPELERVVSEWLHESASPSGAERVLGRAIVRVSTAGQQRRLLPWRLSDLVSSKLAIGGVALLAVVVVAIVLSPPSMGPGAGSPSPTPPATPAPTTGASAPGDRTGELVVVSREGVRFSLTGIGGWEQRESLIGINHITKDYRGSQGAEAVIYWTIVDSVDAFPCYYLRNRSLGSTAAEFAAVIADAPGIDISSGPVDTTVGGRRAKLVVFTVREDVGCDPGFFYAWAWPDGGAMWSETQPGDTVQVWLVDTDGRVLFLEGISHEDAGPAAAEDIQAIVESLQFK